MEDFQEAMTKATIDPCLRLGLFVTKGMQLGQVLLLVRGLISGSWTVFFESIGEIILLQLLMKGIGSIVAWRIEKRFGKYIARQFYEVRPNSLD